MKQTFVIAWTSSLVSATACGGFAHARRPRPRTDANAATTSVRAENSGERRRNFRSKSLLGQTTTSLNARAVTATPGKARAARRPSSGSTKELYRSPRPLPRSTERLNSRRSPTSRTSVVPHNMPPTARPEV